SSRLNNNIDFHLYILSDDEIINLDSLHNSNHSNGWYYVIDKDGNPNKFYSENGLYKYFGGGYYSNGNAVFRKVIATNNPDLIKEGIASIDDEFIKEYVKSPVEEVLVEYFNYKSFIGEDIDKKAIYTETPKLSSNGSIIIKPFTENWDDVFKKVSLLSKGYF